MSGDYISREAVRPDTFCEGVSCQDCPFCKDPVQGGCRIDDFVKSIPAADVVEVVRCYECIHHDEERPFHYCRRLRRDCPDDCEFFCAFGKRKDGGPDA